MPAAYGQNPVANFDPNVTQGCAPLTVSFKDLSTGNPTSWNWEFSNGTLSSVQNPIITFSAPGVYSVKLVVQNANGIAEVERIDYITVFPSPTPEFTSNLALGCVPSDVTFTDLSTGSITAWEWDFGDGGTSNQQNPTHRYTSTGFYSVTLSITSSNGCKSVLSKGSFVRIVGNINTDFVFSNPTTCRAPFGINFTNQSSGPGNITYNWDFGNGQSSGQTDPSTIYNAPGTYTVRLNAQSDLGCTGSVVKTVTINPIVTDFIVPTICLNQPATFQNASTPPPLSSFWDFGDGTTSAQINPIKTFLVAGDYDVSVINRYAGCIDSNRHLIRVTDKPVVDFIGNNGDTASCTAPFSVQFTDRSAGAISWQWDFGDGSTSNQQNPVHQYMSYGNYNVTLSITTQAGCTNTITKTNYIIMQPVSVQLNLPSGGCTPFTYTPVANISSVDNNVVSYAWNFGNGVTSTLQNPPAVVYSSEGVFTVSLTVTTQDGCVVTQTGEIRTGVPATPGISVSPLDQCASQSFSFTGTATGITPGARIEWIWDFGDGEFSNDQNPVHEFKDTGTQIVRLTVSNNLCQTSTTQIIVARPPLADFDVAYDCVTGFASFNNTSLADPGASTYAWSFGNGSPNSTAHTPLPVAYTPGTYNISLTVTSGACQHTFQKTLEIPNDPVDFVSPDAIACKNESFTLSATMVDPANVVSYNWTVGGTPLSNNSATVSYSLPATGQYDVSLTIIDINGCPKTVSKTNYITINGPAANFNLGATGACLNKAFNFTDLSTPAASISQWTFDFGDGSQQSFNAPPFQHTYANTGGYTVSLTIKDNAGCTDRFELPNPVLVTNPVAGFMAPVTYCPQADLPFTDTSSGVGLSHTWTFGDGNTSTLANPTNRYPVGDADYTVKLKVRDQSGCEDSVTKNNYIRIRSPKASFDIKDTATICLPLNTFFTLTGQDYESVLWDFGDGTSTSQLNPNHFYGMPGQYTPTLTLTGPGGCTDVATSSVTVYDPNTFTQISYGPITTACNSLNVDFNLVVPPGFPFVFHFGDGTVDSSGRTSFSHFYPRPSINDPFIIIRDTAAGCQAGKYGGTAINVLGAIPLFAPDDDEFCDNGTVNFKDYTTKNEPIISTVWNFGDGSISNATEPSHYFANPGLYQVRLDITTQSNCSSSYTDTVLVYRTPVPSIVSRDTICVNQPEAINGIIAVPDTLIEYKWTFGNGQTSNQSNNTITYSSAGDYTLSLTATNKIGCSNTDTKLIYVSPLPTAKAVQDPITIISGGSTNLPMDYTGNIISYNWTPATRLNCLDCPLPVANPQSTMKYTVHVEDVHGCRNTGDVTVIVVCNNLNFFVPNTFSPNGDGQNEMFYPRGTGLFRIKSLIVFNRWGQVVFERKDMPVNNASAGWNGMFNGKPASPDVYVYTMEILCDNNTVIPVKGNVTLLR